MNAMDALKLANARGSVAMVHARELAIRRELVATDFRALPPLAIVGIGLGAGALLGAAAKRHPLVASVTTGIAALLRYAPADTLMKLWEKRMAEPAPGGITAAVAAAVPSGAEVIPTPSAPQV